MTPGWRAAVQLLVACSVALTTTIVWDRARTVVVVAPVIDGEPVTTSISYDPQLLMLMLLIAAVAGVLGVAGAARLLRVRRAHRAPTVPATVSH